MTEIKVSVVMKKIKLFMLLLCAVTMISCDSQQKQAQTTKTDVSADDPAVEKAKEDIVGRIKKLYATIAQREEITDSFACRSWCDTVDAVENKDADVAEIGFFNDDLWTQMQDDNPDDFEVRDLKFLQLDVEKGTAMVDFVLWSSVQTVHQKFAFCHDDGEWRVHNIIRCNTDSDGKDSEFDFMEAMKEYLAEP